jgi:molybdate transport system substrate-binding protein
LGAIDLPQTAQDTGFGFRKNMVDLLFEQSTPQSGRPVTPLGGWRKVLVEMFVGILWIIMAAAITDAPAFLNPTVVMTLSFRRDLSSYTSDSFAWGDLHLRHRMMKRMAILGLVAGVLLGQATAAAEITVLSAGAVEPGLRPASVAFEKRTGHAVKVSFAPAPQIRARITVGEMWDVVIAPPAVLDEFAKAGKIENERVTLGRVGMGVAVRAGAPVPDISTVEALKRSVLDAESVVFTRGSSGVYFEALLKKMGLYEQVEGRITRYDESAIEHVLKSKGKEVSFGQLTELRLYRDKGLRLVGPLPAEVQNYTSYVGVPMTARVNADVARAFVRYLGSSDGQAVFAAAGIER